MAEVTIKQSGASPPGDYTSLFSANATEQTDITGLGPAEFKCYGFDDDAAVNIIGWILTATDYIRIYGAPTADGGEEAGIHDGTSRAVSGTGYRLRGTVAGATSLVISEEFVRVEDIDISHTNAAASQYMLQFAAGAVSEIIIDRCIIHDINSSPSTTYVVHNASHANANPLLRNCIIYGKKRGYYSLGLKTVVEQDIFFTDPTDAGTHGVLCDDNSTINNTYAGGYSTEDIYTGSTPPSGDYNISADTSATVDFVHGVGSKAAADQFENASVGASADFNPKTGAFIIGAAPRLAGVLEDILGTSRVDPTTVGAFEAAVAGAISPNASMLIAL